MTLSSVAVSNQKGRVVLSAFFVAQSCLVSKLFYRIYLDGRASTAMSAKGRDFAIAKC